MMKNVERYIWNEGDLVPLRAAAARNFLDIVDSNTAKISVAVRYAFSRARKVARASYDVEKTCSALAKALSEVLPDTLLMVMQAGGDFAAEALQIRSLSSPLRAAADELVGFKFNVANKHAQKWAKEHSAELIDGITETSRKRINRAIQDLVKGEDWNVALDEILDEVGEDDRAENIAHHETMLAASQGQREAWGQAVDEGLLTGNEQRTWIFTPVGACDVCEALDGELAPLGLPYVSDGEEYEGPPAHVGCRCTEGIAVLPPTGDTT